MSESKVRVSRRGHWGAAFVLALAVLFPGVLDGFPLVALPLAVLLLGFAGRRRWWWAGMAFAAAALALVPVGGALSQLSRGWALVLGASFLTATVLRPRWRPFSRALAAMGAASALVGIGLAASGGWARLDWAVTDHFRAMAALTSRELLGRFPDAAWAVQFTEMSRQMVEVQGSLFPALLALQSLAALVLVWWAFVRSRPHGARGLALRPLREFRFNDALIWVVIVGLVLILLPLGEGASRAGYNLLLFMGALYALRGLAVFLFLARGAPTATSVILGALAAIFFYPLVFTAALLVGLGDTWLDVRGRAVAATQV